VQELHRINLHTLYDELIQQKETFDNAIAQ